MARIILSEAKFLRLIIPSLNKRILSFMREVEGIEESGDLLRSFIRALYMNRKNGSSVISEKNNAVLKVSVSITYPMDDVVQYPIRYEFKDSFEERYENFLSEGKLIEEDEDIDDVVRDDIERIETTFTLLSRIIESCVIGYGLKDLHDRDEYEYLEIYYTLRVGKMIEVEI